MLRNSSYLLFQVRGTTPELLGISVTSDGSCMSPYRDYDLRSERKMRASVGRTASFMSTSTGSRPQPLGKIGITLVIQQNTMKLCIRIQKYFVFYRRPFAEVFSSHFIQPIK